MSVVAPSEGGGAIVAEVVVPGVLDSGWVAPGAASAEPALRSAGSLEIALTSEPPVALDTVGSDATAGAEVVVVSVATNAPAVETGAVVVTVVGTDVTVLAVVVVTGTV